MKTRSMKMSDAVGAKLKKLASDASAKLKVGFIESDQAAIAFYNEFGHKGRFPAPARPFFRTMIANNESRWPAKVGVLLKATAMNGQNALALMGEEIDGELKQSIRDLESPALSPTTLRLRLKFGNQPQNIRASDVVQAQREVAAGAQVASGTQAKPLIWTGQMIQSTSFQVDSGPVMQNNEGTYQERS